MTATKEAERSPTIDVGRPYRLIQARHGWFLVNPNDFYLGQAIVRYGECCELEVAFLTQLKLRRGRLVEVGANAGLLTLPLAKALAVRGETLDVFEPQPFLFQNLCANLALNGIANVRAWPFACGEEAGVVRFPAPDYATPGNFGAISMEQRPLTPEGATKPMLSAPCVRLDDFLGGVPVALVKIDVEGFELKVLKGAQSLLSKSRPLLYVENDRVSQSRALIEYLWSLGYRLWWHTPALFNPNNYRAETENIYGNVASFNMVGFPKEFDVSVQGASEILDAGVHPLAKD